MDQSKITGAKNGGIGCAVLFGIAALIGLLIAGSGENTSQTTDAKSTSDAPPSNEITDAKYKEAVRQLIMSNGYDCPNITNLDILDPATPYGPKLEALCGFPNDDTHVNVNLNYAVYPERFLVQTCKPWAMFSNGCN